MKNNLNIKTASVVIQAPKNKVFQYLSNIDNTPKWATEFIKELKIDNGKYKAVTPMGEVFFKLETDEKTGVIDMFLGPSEDRMTIFPSRVISLPGELTVYLFTLFQDPHSSDEQFQQGFDSLKKELKNIKKELS